MGLIEDLREVGERLRKGSSMKAINDACEGFGVPYGGRGGESYGDGLANVLGKIAERIKQEHITVPLGRDGKPLKVGRHYFGKDGRAWIVLGFKPYTYDVIGICGENINTHLKGCWLSAERPDTQERIDADKGKSMVDYWGCSKSSCDECPAMVDGKRPYERYGINNLPYTSCIIAQGYDLAVRQARLDGRA